LQGTGSVGFATTASLLEVSSSQQQISSSLLQVSSSQQQISASLLNVIANYATTGSNSFRANQSITGSLVVSSTITAQTLVVQTVTSSIVYSSGSNIFGSALGDRQTFTGSIQASGSSNHFLLGGSVGIGTTNPIRPLHINAAADTRLVITDSNVSTTAGLYIRQFGSASAIVNNSNGTFQLATNDTYFLTANASGQVGIGTTQPSYTLDVAGTGRFTTTNTTPLILQTTAGNCGIQILTSATTHNWLVAAQYSAANTFEITPSTAVGGQTYSTPVFKITNGGAATFASSLYAASVISSGTSISAATYVSAPSGFYSISETRTIPFTTWTTLTTVDSNIMGMYLVVIGLTGGGLGDWAATGILYSNGTTASWIVGPTNGSLVQLRISGTNIQVYQNGGSPSQNLSYKLLKIA
jgi:hypothetical protein